MQLDARLAVLRMSTVWAGLPPGDLQQLAVAMRPHVFQAGDRILAQGQVGSGLYVVASGQAEARLGGPNGNAVRLATLGPGDCFGEMSLFTGEGASADVVAVTELAALTLDPPEFEALVAGDPARLRGFLALLSRRLSATDSDVSAASERAAALVSMLQDQPDAALEVIGRDPVTRELARSIERVAQLAGPVLIQGERGVGKELVAQLIHYGGPRRDAPLLSVSAADITASDWGDSLFGTVGGAAGEAPVSYLQLAAGGSLLLKNVELLPRPVQQRLVRYLAQPSGVRVMATTWAGAVEESAELTPELAAVLATETLTVPPLRDRKRDIPLLAQHFLEKHAARLDRPVTGFDDEALRKLVSDDYGYANVRELEEAVERAVVLTDGPSVGAAEVFLGVPRRERPRGVNLLALPAPLKQLLLAVFPKWLKPLAALFFIATVVLCFLSPLRDGHNLGLILSWCFWWPAAFLSFLFFGRSWCAICPMAEAGVQAQRRVGRELKIPAWIKDREMAVLIGGFFLIMWLEEALRMRVNPLATGLLLVVITSLAVVTSILYPRRTWCRHLCPLGGLASVCSTSSMLELRPDADVCTAKCKGHACYKGDEHVAGCPMFQHVMFVDTNQHCVLCLDCVRACPNDSPQLLLRPPGRELGQPGVGRPEAGLFAAMLAGLLPTLALLLHWETAETEPFHTWLHTSRTWFVTVTMLLGAGLPLAGAAWAGRRALRSGGPAEVETLYRRLMAWLPLIVAGLTAYQFGFIPGLAQIQTLMVYATGGADGPALHFSLLAAVQVFMLSCGLAVTLGALWNLSRDDAQPGRWRALVAVGVYWGLLLCAFLRPGWFTP